MNDLTERLDRIANRLVPVSGYLMYVATSNGRCAQEPDEHEEGCDCECCRAFLGTQDCITQLAKIVDELRGKE